MFNGKRITIRRVKMNLTQQELSLIAGLDKSTISLYEWNRKEPRASSLERLAKALKVSPSYFFTDKIAKRQQRRRVYGKKKIVLPKGI